MIFFSNTHIEENGRFKNNNEKTDGARVKRVRAPVTEKGPAAMGGAADGRVGAADSRHSAANLVRNDFRGTRGIVAKKKPVKNPRKTADRGARATECRARGDRTSWCGSRAP